MEPGIVQGVTLEKSMTLDTMMMTEKNTKMKIIPVTNSIVDCFWGEGFYQWARVKITKGKPKIIGLNDKLPESFWEDFHKCFSST